MDKLDGLTFFVVFVAFGLIVRVRLGVTVLFFFVVAVFVTFGAIEKFAESIYELKKELNIAT